jgi:hypothetical protein
MPLAQASLKKKGTIRSFALSEDSWEEEVFNNIAIASG